MVEVEEDRTGYRSVGVDGCEGGVEGQSRGALGRSRSRVRTESWGCGVRGGVRNRFDSIQLRVASDRSELRLASWLALAVTSSSFVLVARHWRSWPAIATRMRGGAAMKSSAAPHLFMMEEHRARVCEVADLRTWRRLDRWARVWIGVAGRDEPSCGVRRAIQGLGDLWAFRRDQGGLGRGPTGCSASTLAVEKDREVWIPIATS